VVVSSGPFVRFETTDPEPVTVGGSIDSGERTFSIRVEAPPWIGVDTVELVKGGHVIRRWNVGGRKPIRLDVEHTMAVTSGDWLIVVASSKKSMKSTYRKGAKPFAFTNPIWVR
jgi:hypothetical protein